MSLSRRPGPAEVDEEELLRQQVRPTFSIPRPIRSSQPLSSCAPFAQPLPASEAKLCSQRKHFWIVCAERFPCPEKEAGSYCPEDWESGQFF